MVSNRALSSPVRQNSQSLFLALRGSGQALYVGLGDDCFVVASEPYGVVEETSKFLRLEGEQAAVPGNPNSRGEIYVLDYTLNKATAIYRLEGKAKR